MVPLQPCGRNYAGLSLAPRVLALAKSRVPCVRVQAQVIPDFIPQAELELISEPAVRNMAARMQRAAIPVRSLGTEVPTAYVGPSAEEQARHREAGAPPLMLLHGFDSSLLEFRRLYPLLEQSAETWAVDKLGWGFNDHTTFTQQPELLLTPQERREHLYAFWQAKIQRPMVIVGASLGGAAAMDFALAHPEAVEKLVLIDSAGWTEPGTSKAPRFVAAAGVWVLRTDPLRQMANVMAYKDKGLATDDARRTGRLHTYMPGWTDANIAFVRGGGYRIAASIPNVQQPTLVLWGRQDEIIEPTDAGRFEAALPNSKLVWIEECGHCGHLEQPAFTSQQVLQWAGVTLAQAPAGAAAATAAL